jgi:hypothetical protein
MTGAAAQAPIFSRGSNVLEYWLLHAEGLVVRPLGARVEEVIAPAPFDRAETLIVRTRMRHRRIAIPARAVTAVEPAAGVLLLDRHAAAPSRREPAWKLFRGHVRETVSAVVVLSRRVARWSSPRAQRLAAVAADRTVAGARWLAPRVVALSGLVLAVAAYAAGRVAAFVRLRAWPWAASRYGALRRRWVELRGSEGRPDPARHRAS